MDFKQELAALLAAQASLLYVVSDEEERVLCALAEIEPARPLGITSWDVADGFEIRRAGKEPFPAKDCTTDSLLPHVAEKMPKGHSAPRTAQPVLGLVANVHDLAPSRRRAREPGERSGASRRRLVSGLHARLSGLLQPRDARRGGPQCDVDRSGRSRDSGASCIPRTGAGRGRDVAIHFLR